MRWIVAAWIALTLSACSGAIAFKEHKDFVQEDVLNNPNMTTYYIETRGFQLHVKEIGAAKKAIVVWIHGTPGDWTNGSYLLRDESFISQVKLVMLDRPGWGQSQYRTDPRAVTSFSEISRLIAPLLRQLKESHPKLPLLLVGFSWGGSVVPSIAIDYPEWVDGVLVLAGGLDPELTKPRWYHKLADTTLGRAVIGANMRKANTEMLALSPQLSILASRWPQLSQPAIVVQGTGDSLVDPRNADFAAAVLAKKQSRVLRLDGQGHLLQLERMGLIARCIIALVEGELNQCA